MGKRRAGKQNVHRNNEAGEPGESNSSPTRGHHREDVRLDPNTSRPSADEVRRRALPAWKLCIYQAGLPGLFVIYICLLYLVQTRADVILAYINDNGSRIIDMAHALPGRIGGMLLDVHPVEALKRIYDHLPSQQTVWIVSLLSFEIATCIAFIWIGWRAYLVLSTPTTELIEILGIEVPEAPNVSLAGIEERSVRIIWSKPTPQDTVVNYYIQLNGVLVGKLERNENSIDINGLEPNTRYAIKVVATNGSNFEAGSRVILLQTLPAGSKAGKDVINKPNSNAENAHTVAGRDDASNVRSNSSHSEVASSVSTPPNMTREHSATQSATKRARPAKQHSPANATSDQALQGSSVQAAPRHDDDLSNKTVEELTVILEAARANLEDIERQAAEEELEHQISQAAMIKERDKLRQILKEKEEHSAELKRTAANLDIAARAAQRKNAAEERKLQQKKEERQKMADDIARWKRETEEMEVERLQVVKEMEELKTSGQAALEALHRTHDQEKAKVRVLEDKIKTIGIEIKQHEDLRRKQETDGDDDEEAAQHAQQKLEWEGRLRNLKSLYNAKLQSCQQAQAEYHKAMETATFWQNLRASDPSQFAPLPSTITNPVANKSRNRKPRQRKSRTNTITSPAGGISVPDPTFTSTPALESASSTSPIYPSSTPFFNINNGMSAAVAQEQNAYARVDNENLTVGGPLSPSATALIPSNLLGDDEPPSPLTHSSHPFPSSVGPRNPFEAHFPSLDSRAYGPNSPESPISQTASAFASPRDSFSKLRSYPTELDGPLDSDRRSVHSNAGSLGAIGTMEPYPVGSRFSGLFGLNRQRGKTLRNDPPQLGSLKASQSQSVPRSLEPEEAPLDPIGTRRRRGSYSGNWANPMASLLGRTTASGNDVPEASGSEPLRASTSRRRPFNMFSPKYDPLEPSKFLDTTSSRPSSEHSRDNSLPRPSSDSQPFGWPATENLGHRSSPLGPDWSAPEVWSLSNSRRQSMQYGSTTSLPIGMSPLEAEALHNKLSKQTSPTTSIGTRSRTRPDIPKLNPAAPSFKTLFGRSDAKKAEKAAEKEKKESELLPEEASPPNPRHSRDSRSIATQDSIAESHDSLDRSTSGTPSESLTPSSKDKETFIQKITRKSSSSKFNIPWKDKGGLFSKKAGEQSTPGEIEEDGAGEVQLEKGVDSTTSSPQIGSGRSGMHWSHLMRKSKKGSEKASEAGDDDDE